MLHSHVIQCLFKKSCNILKQITSIMRALTCYIDNSFFQKFLFLQFKKSHTQVAASVSVGSFWNIVVYVCLEYLYKKQVQRLISNFNPDVTWVLLCPASQRLPEQCAFSFPGVHLTKLFVVFLCTRNGFGFGEGSLSDQRSPLINPFIS